jgi:hypothetical protein
LKTLAKFVSPSLPVISPLERILVSSALNQDGLSKTQNGAPEYAFLCLHGRQRRQGRKLNKKDFDTPLGYLFGP